MPRVSVELAELLRLYDSGMTLKAIADKYGVKKQAVHQRLKNAGYNARPSSFRQVRRFDRETLFDLYVTQHLSQKQIARRLKTAESNVASELRRLGIKVRGQGAPSKYRPFLENLKVGDSVMILWTGTANPHPTLHLAAKRSGIIKVSIKKGKDGQIRVTRIS